MAGSSLELATEMVIDNMERNRRTSHFYDDPAAWVEYMTGMKLWSKQREIAQSVVHNRSTAVKAGHGVGKSLLVAALACWWVDTRYPNAIVASTAPSTQQIGAIVWKEIRKINNLIAQRYRDGIIDHKLPGVINSNTQDNKWTDGGGIILGYGKKPPDGKEDDSFQGVHDGYVLAIGDEACGLSGEIIGALGNIASNEGSRRILIANPTAPGSYFASLFSEDKGWALFTISVFDLPAFTDEKHDMSPEALAKMSGVDYPEGMAKEYGADSATYKMRVLGEFSMNSSESLIGTADYARGFDAPVRISDDDMPILGVDVARHGPDKTVIYKRLGNTLRFVDAWGGKDEQESTAGTATANRIHRAALDACAKEVRIDGSGMGGPILDMVVGLSEGKYTVVSMLGGASSPNRFKWHNARAFWYDRVRRDLRALPESLINIDPDDKKLENELCSIGFSYRDDTGAIKIENKDDMRARGIKSPDYSDAAIYALADLSALEEDPFSQHIGEKLVFDVQEDFAGMTWANTFAW